MRAPPGAFDMLDSTSSLRLAVLLSHPIQYYSPWLRHLAARPELRLKVFYLWDFGVKPTMDRSFSSTFAWDIPLLDGYESVFLPNQSKDPGTHHFGGLDNPGAAAALREWGPDVVLTFGYVYKTFLQLFFSPLLWRTPFVFRGDSHELFPATGWKSKLGRLLRIVLFRRFALFLAVGEANREYFRRSGIPDRRVAFVPHCVDNERFRAARQQSEVAAVAWKKDLGIPDEAIVFLFAGKFEEKKRPLDLLRAFQEARASRPMAKKPMVLLFVGSGAQEAQLRAVAGDAIGCTVFFAPFQNQSQMPMVYAAGDILVLPSFGRSETWGLAVNEAMNLGKPAIVSSHVGCGPDLIVEGETGWTFEAGNPSALRDCLCEAVSASAEFSRMGEAALRKVNEYSFAVAGDCLVKALERLPRKQGASR